MASVQRAARGERDLRDIRLGTAVAKAHAEEAAMRWTHWAALVGVACIVVPGSGEAQMSVCVEVEVRSWADLDLRADTGADAEAEADADADADADAGADAEAEAEAEAGSGAGAGAGADAEAEAGAGAGADADAEVEPIAEPGAETGGSPEQGLGAPEFPEERTGWRTPPTPNRPAATPSSNPTPNAPPVVRPVFEPPLYLRRLLEYGVTHTPGFESVPSGCAERLMVELYPLEEGWTVFARYTGSAREEKVDQVQVDELRPLAQRLVSSLLGDRPIETTLTRRSVLRDDSEGELRRVRGRGHTRFSIGTEIIVGLLPTARTADATATDEIRVSAPLAIDAGARSTYRGWALDAYAGILVGTSRQSVSGAGRGHADYTFGLTAALHFLRYTAPDSAASFYGGGGSSFQLHRYRILPGERGGDDEGLVGGGLNVDLIMGYEVMRASALSFFVEVQAHLPAYAIDSENVNGRIRAWLPAAVVQIGLLR